MISSAKSVEEYLTELPSERREALSRVREMILKHLPEGYEEVMQYGMISYIIPLDDYSDTYNGQPLAYISLASQKNHMALYLMGIYSEPDGEKWFQDAYIASGKKLDMGKSCVRFKELEDVPLDVIGQAVARLTPDQFIELYESSRKQ